MYLALLGMLLLTFPCFAQDFSQRGFLETTGIFYPQTAPNDSSHVTAGSLLRYEAFYKLLPELKFSAGLDARTDTHGEVERRAHVSWWDRERARPALELRRLSAAWQRGGLTVEAGKQFVRWGKADILNPTDRFAPRDFLNVVETEYLPITAVRATYGGQTDTIDVVWSPRFTPSRIPLLNQRWANLPPNLPVAELSPAYPGGSQAGARWNHIGGTMEYSLSVFDGYNHLPLFRLPLQRWYPRIQTFGGDFAMPLKFISVKGEAAWFSSGYTLYVLQLERQTGEWSFVGGYAGEVTTRSQVADFSPERGMARAFVGRAGYTIDTNRNVAFEFAARQNGHGVWAKGEYSHALGQHWRAVLGFAYIGGRSGDFLGQYNRNSHAIVAFRYSF